MGTLTSSNSRRTPSSSRARSPWGWMSKPAPSGSRFGCFSKTSTRWPSLASAMEVARPAGPAPAMPILSFCRLLHATERCGSIYQLAPASTRKIRAALVPDQQAECGQKRKYITPVRFFCPQAGRHLRSVDTVAGRSSPNVMSLVWPQTRAEVKSSKLGRVSFSSSPAARLPRAALEAVLHRRCASLELGHITCIGVAIDDVRLVSGLTYGAVGLDFAAAGWPSAFDQAEACRLAGHDLSSLLHQLDAARPAPFGFRQRVGQCWRGRKGGTMHEEMPFVPELCHRPRGSYEHESLYRFPHAPAGRWVSPYSRGAVHPPFTVPIRCRPMTSNAKGCYQLGVRQDRARSGHSAFSPKPSK